MKIAFFTEGSHVGKVPRDHRNMRTDLAWAVALDADHIPFNGIATVKYDVGIVILPKKNVARAIENLDRVYRVCDVVGIMQEGPNDYWQDYTVPEQIGYFNALKEADFILCHNKSDQNYYTGLLGTDNVHRMPALMIPESMPDISVTNHVRNGVMVGGNMTSWYSGFDSMVVAHEFEEPIFLPSMGRRSDRENEMWPEATYLPYMAWHDWIVNLNRRKFAVHLMRTHAAGTFALNCAYLGIPCIGYHGLDTQDILHPHTTVDMSNLSLARKIALMLKKDKEFYEMCALEAKLKAFEYFSEIVFVDHMTEFLEKIISEKK